MAPRPAPRSSCPALPLPYPVCHHRRIDTTMFAPKGTGNDWKNLSALPNFCPHRQTDTMFALIYKISILGVVDNG